MGKQPQRVHRMFASERSLGAPSRSTQLSLAAAPPSLPSFLPPFLPPCLLDPSTKAATALTLGTEG